MTETQVYELGELTKEICQAAMREAYLNDRLQCQHASFDMELSCLDEETGYVCIIGALPIAHHHFMKEDTTGSWVMEFIRVIRDEVDANSSSKEHGDDLETWLEGIMSLHDTIFTDAPLEPLDEAKKEKLKTSLGLNWAGLRYELGIGETS